MDLFENFGYKSIEKQFAWQSTRRVDKHRLRDYYQDWVDGEINCHGLPTYRLCMSQRSSMYHHEGYR